jgi:catechol 2,3-dioxygenase-like lactoylglutathione lyase family enzyme
MAFITMFWKTIMQVKRIVSNITTPTPERADEFYNGILGLDLLMDQGWIRTYGADTSMSVQISFAAEGGAGTTLPELSIEVDNLDQAIDRFNQAGVPIEYGPVTEPWGVRRFYVRDPFGKLLNIPQHV